MLVGKLGVDELELLDQGGMFGLDFLDGLGSGLVEEVLITELLVELLELLRGLGTARLEALLLLGEVNESR